MCSVGPIRLIINRDTFCSPEKPRNNILTNPSIWRWKIIRSKILEKNFVEISACARKSGKNMKICHFELGIEKAGSTGRQNVHGHRIRVCHAILHLQLRGFVKICGTSSKISSEMPFVDFFYPSFSFIFLPLKDSLRK